ncbi:MAG: hypothetical protein GX189_06170 [Clostridiales bacterium]|jgi:hypothetical protein|nr:hypothetical protein [Clostridiales bacterium]
MLHDTELLQYVYKTTDMGCKGIQSVLDRAKSENLKSTLTQQQREYAKLRDEARAILESKREKPKGVSPVSKLSADMMTSLKMMTGRSDSKIAEMTIQGNQLGITKTAKHLNNYSGGDETVRSLTKKLLETEEANAKQLQRFL